MGFWPYLHYEIRDSETEHIINPLHFGVIVKDSIAPTITRLIGYPIHPDKINGNNEKLDLPVKRNGTLLTNRITAIGDIVLESPLGTDWEEKAIKMAFTANES